MISIEPMTASHLEDVRVLSIQLGYEVEAKEFKNRFHLLERNQDHAQFVAVDDGRAIGWIHLSLIYALIEDLRTEIKAFVIDEKYRGRRVGRLMIDYTKEWSKSRGAKKIFLRTNIIREDAHRFYEREKFKKMKTSHIYERAL